MSVDSNDSGAGGGLIGSGSMISKCGNCGDYNSFGFGVGTVACYCKACGLNPYGDTKKVMVKVKPKYKWSWKLNKAVKDQ